MASPLQKVWIRGYEQREGLEDTYARREHVFCCCVCRVFVRAQKRNDGQVENRGAGKIIVKDYQNAQYYGEVRMRQMAHRRGATA